MAGGYGAAWPRARLPPGTRGGYPMGRKFAGHLKIPHDLRSSSGEGNKLLQYCCGGRPEGRGMLGGGRGATASGLQNLSGACAGGWGRHDGERASIGWRGDGGLRDVVGDGGGGR